MSHLLSLPKVALLGLAFIAGLAAHSTPQDQPSANRPRILVTNDDGIEAPGLTALVRELAKVADVVVSAPPENRSGASQSLSYFVGAKLITQAQVEGAISAVAVDGTPADAAHFGLVQFGTDKPFDMLIVGMNHGSNVGDLSHGSGTVGAAMEGAMCGIPSMAVSMDARTRDFEPAAAFARRFAEEWLKRGLDPGVVYSLNIPAQTKDGWKGVRAVPMGGAYLNVASYRKGETTEEGTEYWPALTIEKEFPEGSDSAAYADGYVTITPLRFDWTDREALAELANWDLK